MLAEFCECGSLVIDGRCSNKNCTLRAAANPATVVKTARGRTPGKKADAVKQTRAPNPRRASKCITYNLNDITDRESGS